MSVKQRILDLVGERITDKDWLGQERNVELREIMSDTEFYLQKGQDAYHQFDEYFVNQELLQSVYRKINSIPREAGVADEIRGELFSTQYSFNENNEFHNRLETLVAYLDKNATGRKKLNEYHPHRNVARTMVQPHDWYINLVRLKLRQNKEISSSCRNAMDYITDPLAHVSMTSEKARIRFSVKVLERAYDNNKFTGQIKEMFSAYQTYVKNQQNFTIFCIRWLYDADIKRIWQ